MITKPAELVTQKNSVVKLVPKDNSDKDRMVEILEAALERAKAGELTGVAIVTDYEDGSSIRYAGFNNNNYTLVGAIEALKVSLFRDC